MKKSLSQYLNKKIVLPTTIVSTISAIVLMIFLTTMSSKNIRTDLETRNESITNELQSYIDSYKRIEKEWNNNQYCVEFLLLNGIDQKLTQNIVSTLNNVAVNEASIVNTWIFQENTKKLYTNDGGIIDNYDFEGSYISQDTKFDENFYITSPYVDSVTKDTVITMYYCITYNNKRIGVIGFDIALDSIPEMVQSHKFDLDGKAMLIADEGIVLSSPNESENGKNVSELDISDKFIERIQSNGNGSIKCKYNGKSYRMIYKTVPNSKWTIIVITPIASIIKKVVLESAFMLVTLLLLNILVAFILTKESKKISKKVAKLADQSIEISNENYNIQLEIDDETEIGSLQEATIKILDRLVEYKSYIAELSGQMDYMSNCDYTHTTTLDYTGEFALIKGSLDTLKEETVELVSELGQVSSSIVSGAGEISMVSGHLAQGAEAQTNCISNFSQELNNLLSLLEETISMLHEVEGKSNNANSQVLEGTGKMNKLVHTMNHTKNTANEITNILQTQKEISARINLLSLNASIEAARAGEAGLGFAVVAQEIGKLADESAKATAETSVLIENTINAVNEGQDMVTETNTSFTSLSGDIADMVTAFNQNIAGLVGQIQKFDSIKKGVLEINDIASDTLAVSEETAASAESFTEYAEQLKSLIDKYTI